MKHILQTFFLLLLFADSALAKEEIVERKDGTSFIILDDSAVKEKKLPVQGCVYYAFYNDQKYTLLPDDSYIGADSTVSVVTKGCIYIIGGQATLSNNTRVYSASIGPFGLDEGYRAYTNINEKYQPLPDGKYTLKNGETFTVTNGFIDDLGFFKDDQLFFENRD